MTLEQRVTEAVKHANELSGEVPKELDNLANLVVANPTIINGLTDLIAMGALNYSSLLFSDPWDLLHVSAVILKYGFLVGREYGKSEIVSETLDKIPG